MTRDGVAIGPTASPVCVDWCTLLTIKKNLAPYFLHNVAPHEAFRDMHSREVVACRFSRGLPGLDCGNSVAPPNSHHISALKVHPQEHR
jgi:hypothetical protein